MKQIVLKSNSPRRKEILLKEGYNFIVKPSDIDEVIDNNLSPKENTKRIALLKASYNKGEDYGKIIIGCDTIVTLDDVIYGKPKDRLDAYNMLKKFSGKKQEVISGVAIIYKELVYNFYVISNVWFKELTDNDINSYLDTNEPYDKAGSYAIQGIGRRLILKYDGELENIIGLPIKEIKEILGEINEMED